MDDDEYGAVDGMSRSLWVVEKTEVLWEKLPQCHFVHNKSNMTWPELELVPPWWEVVWTWM
jgi:hypothetical protein